jgi:hypothetical protein
VPTQLRLATVEWALPISPIGVVGGDGVSNVSVVWTEPRRPAGKWRFRTKRLNLLWTALSPQSAYRVIEVCRDKSHRDELACRPDHK